MCIRDRVGNVGIGLLLAVILNRKMPKFFVNFFRFSFFLPVVIGYVYVSIVWSNLYSTDTGVFNYFLSLLGLEKVGWLTNKSIVLFSIILMDIWKNAGFFMVIFLAGLQNIPAQYYEAAQIDGEMCIRDRASAEETGVQRSALSRFVTGTAHDGEVDNPDESDPVAPPDTDETDSKPDTDTSTADGNTDKPGEENDTASPETGDPARCV